MPEAILVLLRHPEETNLLLDAAVRQFALGSAEMSRQFHRP